MTKRHLKACIKRICLPHFPNPFNKLAFTLIPNVQNVEGINCLWDISVSILHMILFSSAYLKSLLLVSVRFCEAHIMNESTLNYFGWQITSRKHYSYLRLVFLLESLTKFALHHYGKRGQVLLICLHLKCI